MDDKGAQQLISSLEIVSHVRMLKVIGNPMTSEKQERIAQLLTMNLSSQKLKKVMLQQSRGEKLDVTLNFNGKETGYCLNDE